MKIFVRNFVSVATIREQISKTTEAVFILLEVPVVLRRFQHEGKCRRSKNFVKFFAKNFGKCFVKVGTLGG